MFHPIDYVRRHFIRLAMRIGLVILFCFSIRRLFFNVFPLSVASFIGHVVVNLSAGWMGSGGKWIDECAVVGMGMKLAASTTEKIE